MEFRHLGILEKHKINQQQSWSTVQVLGIPVWKYLWVQYPIQQQPLEHRGQFPSGQPRRGQWRVIPGSIQENMPYPRREIPHIILEAMGRSWVKTLTEGVYKEAGRGGSQRRVIIPRSIKEKMPYPGIEIPHIILEAIDGFILNENVCPPRLDHDLDYLTI